MVKLSKSPRVTNIQPLTNLNSLVDPNTNKTLDLKTTMHASAKIMNEREPLIQDEQKPVKQKSNLLAEGDSSKFRLKGIAEGQIFIKALADELFIDAN